MSFKRKLTMLMGVLLAVLAAFALSIPAHATGTATIASDGNSTFTAYRMFTGTVSGNALYNPQFDTDCAPASIWNSLAPSSVDKSDPRATLDWLASALFADPKSTANDVGTAFNHQGTGTPFSAGETTSLENGYYIITSSSNSLPIVTLIGDGTSLNIDEKPLSPTLKKTSSSNEATAGKPIHFTLESSLPYDYDEYSTYLFEITDTATGLSIDESSMEVNYKSNSGSADIGQSAIVALNKPVLNIGFSDLKTAIPELHGGDQVVVEYDAYLDDFTCGAATPNLNRAILKYSNVPGTSGVGTTPEQVVEVKTFSLEIAKQDKGGAKLEGASFVFKASDGTFWAEGNWVEDDKDASLLTTNSDGIVKIDGLASGTYQIIEKKSPDGYQLPDAPIEISISSETDDQGKVKLTAKTESGYAEIKDVDSATGSISLTVANYKDGEEKPQTPADDDKDSNKDKNDDGIADENKDAVSKAVEALKDAISGTGDPMPLIVLILVIVAAGGTCGFIAWKRKKRE